MGFTKLFSSVTTSSIWVESDATLRIWIAMLAHANQDGYVEGSAPGFASLCRMDLKAFVDALEPLLQPDPYSRTPDNEGRRLEAVHGGWLVLNYGIYRNREQNKAGSRATYQRKWRESKKEGEL